MLETSVVPEVGEKASYISQPIHNKETHTQPTVYQKDELNTSDSNSQTVLGE